MTTLSGRVEVNLCRLLSRCEMMASESNCQDWRLEKVNICLMQFIYIIAYCILLLWKSYIKLENDRFKIYDRCPMSDVAMAISTDADVACLDHLAKW